MKTAKQFGYRLIKKVGKSLKYFIVHTNSIKSHLEKYPSKSIYEESMYTYTISSSM